MDVRFRKLSMKKAKGLSCFLLLVMLNFSDASKNLEVKKKLSQLNKTPLKSITSPDGDIIDCVQVSHQPAFDHPFLKNHKIQMRPNYHPEALVFDDGKESRSRGDKNQITQLWHLNGRCPEGTVPIGRTKEEDVLRASSVENFGKKNLKSTIPDTNTVAVDQFSQPGHEYAIASVQGGTYYGTKATINVWNPHVEQSHEFSLSQLWIVNGSYQSSDLNTIEAGWQVLPYLYGDNNTKLFIFWTRDAYKSCCYNLLCPGFIQTSNKIAFGVSNIPISTYGGSQSAITLLVWKDPKQGNWWLQLGNDTLGYWPASLFTNLDGATTIDWGGEVVNLETNGMHTSTEMGSGHFPEEGSGNASYFTNIQIVDGSMQLKDPVSLSKIVTKPNCYNINLGKTYFYYGGPGRNPNCP